jgi:hypothetical protein
MKKISISIHGMLLDAINVKEIERRQAAHDALVRKVRFPNTNYHACSKGT